MHGQALIPLSEPQGHQLPSQTIHPHISTRTWFIFHSLHYLIVYPQPALHSSPLISKQNLNSSLEKYTHIHPDLLHWSTCKHAFPWYLNPFLNHSNRFLNRHELRNIHLGMTTSQNTAYMHQINKIDHDHFIHIHFIYVTTFH